MAEQQHIQRLRGNTARNDAYRGKDGELVINADSKSIRIHDGVKTGGYGTIDAIHYDTLPDDVPQDLRTGAHVIVGDGRLDGGNVPSTKSSVYAGNTITGGNTGVLVVQERSEGKFYINTTFPEATISKGEVKTEGHEGKLDIVQNSVNNYTINATFPESEVYAAHTDSESASEAKAEIMPEGGIIIERVPGEKPVLKQIVDGNLEATKLGGTQATYTEDADETAAILPDIEDGAMVIEGPGPIVIDADVAVSAVAGNTLERKSDGLFTPKSIVVTANAAETAAILPSLAEGAAIIEGPGDVVVATNARVSEDENNIITTEEDGIAVSIKAILDVIYPVGSYAFGVKPTVGTWEEVEGDRALWLKNDADDGTEIEQALPNITGTLAAYSYNTSSPTGAFAVQSLNPNQAPAGGDTDRNFVRWGFSAASSNSIYKNGANVQPNAYVMKVYKRVA